MLVLSFAFALGASFPFVGVVLVVVVEGCFPPAGCVARVAELDPPVGCFPGVPGCVGLHLPLAELGDSIFGQLVTTFPLSVDAPVDYPCRRSMEMCALVGGLDAGDPFLLRRFLI